MTDGTTGIPVAPITEDEMTKVQDILRRAANAIVGMSQLANDVDSLRQQVAQTQDELNKLRRTNDALEESLSHHRQARQELEQRLADAEQAKTTAQREADDLRENVAHNNRAIIDVRDAYNRAMKDRDDAELRAMEAEDKLKAAEAKLARIAEVFGPEAPKPTPEPVKVESVPTKVEQDTSNPPKVEIDWSRPHHWDHTLGDYVND